MAEHRARTAGKHRAPTTPRRRLASSPMVGAAVLALAMLALLVSLYVAGSKAEDAPATTAPLALVDQGDAPTSMVTLPATTATVTLPATTMAMVTNTAAPLTATVTSTAAPVTVTSTEYPADVQVTTTAPRATVTSTIERAPVTDYVTQDAAPQDASTDYPPCAFEDGQEDGGQYPCEWNGATMGNGTGDSYIVWSDEQF